MAAANRDDFRDVIRKAEEEAEEKASKRKDQAWLPKRARSSIRVDPKEETREDKEPTTAALAKWASKEYLVAFHLITDKIRGFQRAKNIVAGLKFMKVFLDLLDEQDACPRSKLAVVREAARRLPRYKKQWNIPRKPGDWWLQTFGERIVEDLKGLIYSRTSLRYLYTEEIPVDMLKIWDTGSGWVISWEEHRARLHRTQLNEVTNPFLLAKLSQPIPKEPDRDDEDYGGW